MTIIDKRRGYGEGSDAAQQAAQRAIDTNVPNHIKTGVKLSGVSIQPAAAGPTLAPQRVPHQLARVPVGWHSMRVTGSGVGAELVEVGSDANTLTLQRPLTSTGSLTYDLWVF